MKNIERGTIKYLVLLIIFTSICGMVLYPLFDFLLCTFITNSKFVYSFHEYIIQPILFAFLFSLVFWMVDKKK